MPSDCQCSACVTERLVEVIGNKEASKRIRDLEREVAKMRAENVSLKSDLEKATVNKKKLVNRLKKQLDNM